jgi:hypothetical protein
MNGNFSMVLLNGVAIVSLDSAYDAILISVHPQTGQSITLQIHEFQKSHFTSCSFKLLAPEFYI